MTRLKDPPQRTPGRERPTQRAAVQADSEFFAPAAREAVRIRLLEDDVVLPQLVDVWLASWELEAEYRRLDSSTQGYWETGSRWIRAKTLRPD